MKEQLELIRQDINFIEKYKDTDNFDGLINDMLLHLKSAELQCDELQQKLSSIEEYCNITYQEWFNWKQDILEILRGNNNVKN